jgi:hypothetical protein
VNTQKSANSLAGRAAEAAETVYEIAQATATVTADLHSRDPEPTSTPNFLQKRSSIGSEQPMDWAVNATGSGNC